MKNYLYFIILILATGCSRHVEHKYHDSELKIKQDEFRKMLSNQLEELKKHERPRIYKTKIPNYYLKKVSLDTGEKTTIRSALMNIARQAKAPLILSKAFNKKATLVKFSNKNFIEALKAICRVNNLRFETKDGFIYIYEDKSYSKIYKLTFLDFVRTGKNQTIMSTDIFSSPLLQKPQQNANSNQISPSNGGKKDTINNGSLTVLSSESKSDLWSEIASTIKTLCEQHKGSKFTLNKQSGMLILCGKDSIHQIAEQYIKNLRIAMTTQVEIEAKIVEITLSDKYKSGIDWNTLSLLKSSKISDDWSLDLKSQKDHNFELKPDAQFKIGKVGFGIGPTFKFLNEFGTVRTISNPRITVINNQIAVLKIASNEVFFRIKYNADNNFASQGVNTGSQVRLESKIYTVPVGLILSLQPSINYETGDILLHLRPTISCIDDRIKDPGVNLISVINGKDIKEGDESRIPKISIREISSVVKLKDGEVTFLGGIMENKAENTNRGMPVHGLNLLTNNREKDEKKTELVILLKAKIIHSDANSTVNNVDKHLYQKMFKDPRKSSFLAGDSKTK